MASSPQLTGPWSVSRDDEFSNNLIKGLHNLQKSEHLTDFTINVKREKIKAHSAVLASASPYFSALFNSGMREVQNMSVSFDDFDPGVVREILDYMYSGNILIKWGLLIEMIEVCEVLQLSDLKEQCQQFILMNITTNNCIYWYKVSDKYSMSKVKSYTRNLMVSNFRCVITSDSFKDLSVAELIDYIGDPDIPLTEADYILKGIIEWTSIEEESRQPDFARLVNQVNLEQCSSSYLKFVIENFEGYLTDIVLMKKLLSVAFARTQSKDVAMTGTPQIALLGGRTGINEVNLGCWKLDPVTSTWNKFTTLPCTNTKRLHEMKACSLDCKIFVLLVYKSYDDYRCEFYMFENFGWVAQSPPNFRAAEKGIALTSLNQQVYAFCDKDFMCFNMSDSSWETLPSSPRDVCTGEIEMVAVDSKIVVISKSDDTLLLCYDPICTTWQINPIQIPETRGHCSFVGTNQKLFITGGKSDIHYSYEPGLNAWKRLRGPSRGRWGATATALENKLYLTGGTIGSQLLQLGAGGGGHVQFPPPYGFVQAVSNPKPVTDQVEIYDIRDDKWSMSHIRLPSALVGHQLVIVNYID